VHQRYFFVDIKLKRLSSKAGWDTMVYQCGIGYEKELGITKEDIGKISIEEYNSL
jgi:isoleucyl-tRNA synthetase